MNLFVVFCRNCHCCGLLLWLYRIAVLHIQWVQKSYNISFSDLPLTTKDYEVIQSQVKAHAQSHHQARKIPYFKTQVLLYSPTIREEKLFKYDNNLSWAMVSAILITVLIVKAFMLKEEVWCWSHSPVEGAMSREYSYFRLILCWSHYLVPSPIHRMLLWSYEEDIKQLLPGSTSHDNFFRAFLHA